MEDQKILQHLLKVEEKASGLVNDAQAEADRRIARGDAAFRAAYEERIAKESEALEKLYKKETEEARLEYEKQVQSCREEFGSLAVNGGEFAGFLESCLFLKP